MSRPNKGFMEFDKDSANASAQNVGPLDAAASVSSPHPPPTRDWKQLICQYRDQFTSWVDSSLLAKFAVAWLLAVVIDGAILFMSMTGMLNNEFDSAQQRDDWTEITSQIMNVLFTGMAIWNHFFFPYPGGRLQLMYTFLTAHYNSNITLHRAALSSSTRFRSLCALNLNCFAQYPMAYFMWAYHVEERPALGVALPLVLSFSAGIIGGVLEAKANKEDKASTEESFTNVGLELGATRTRTQTHDAEMAKPHRNVDHYQSDGDDDTYRKQTLDGRQIEIEISGGNSNNERLTEALGQGSDGSALQSQNRL